MKFHHIGIATADIDRMVAKLKKHFAVKEISETIFDPKQNAYLCMVTLNDGIMIELINGEVVANILKKRQYLYHTCYAVKNIAEAISSLQNDGAFLVKDVEPAVLFHGQKVAFLMWDLGLIELVEVND